MGRLLLFFLGYNYIPIRGRIASSKEAPVVVSNHMSFVEALYLPSLLLSMVISREENKKVVFIGTIMKQLQVIFVSRTDKDSRNTVCGSPSCIPPEQQPDHLASLDPLLHP